MKQQILAMIANYLDMCSCNIKQSDNLYNLGLVGQKLERITRLLENNFRIKFLDYEISRWKTISDIINTTENKVYHL